MYVQISAHSLLPWLSILKLQETKMASKYHVTDCSVFEKSHVYISAILIGKNYYYYQLINKGAK